MMIAIKTIHNATIRVIRGVELHSISEHFFFALSATSTSLQTYW